jgi:hypothetical protein
MRRRAKVDANQAEIVSALRKAGRSVVDLSAVGNGCTDLLVGWGGQMFGKNILMEIKNDKAQKSDRVLTKAQIDFHRDWRGPIVVVETVEDALEAAGIRKKYGSSIG